MPKRSSSAVWKGTLQDGSGSIKVDEDVYEGPYSFASRFKEGKGTNPEELLAAAHAGCFSMALAHELAQAGFDPEEISTCAQAQLEEVDGDFSITRITLKTKGSVPGISEADFQAYADGAKVNCPVSKALAGVDIELDATLERSA